jgi:hypothetical protein
MLRIWLYRGMTVIVAGIAIYSAVNPWWSCVIEHAQYGYQGTVNIFQYGITDAPMEIAGDITPSYQVVMALAYISLIAVLVVWSGFLKGRAATLLPAVAGLSYIAYALVAVFLVIGPRISELGGQIQGYSEIIVETIQEPVLITTRLQPAYFVACAAGVSSCLLGLIRRPLLK